MHRQAGLRGFSCTPKLSSIDKRYYAEINRHVLNDDGTYRHTHYNVKLGTGDSPIEAAANGYMQVMPDDLAMHTHCLIARVEALLPAMQRRAAALKKLDASLDALTDLVRSANVPRAADPGEDDDL